MTRGTPRTTPEFGTRPRRHFRFATALLVSCAGHALVLAMLLRSPTAARSPHIAAPQAIAVRLQTTSAHSIAPARSDATSGSPKPGPRGNATTPHRLPPTTATRITLPETPPTIDLDAARTEARHFAKQSPAGGGYRQNSAGASSRRPYRIQRAGCAPGTCPADQAPTGTCRRNRACGRLATPAL